MRLMSAIGFAVEIDLVSISAEFLIGIDFVGNQYTCCKTLTNSIEINGFMLLPQLRFGEHRISLDRFILKKYNICSVNFNPKYTQLISH